MSHQTTSVLLMCIHPCYNLIVYTHSFFRYCYLNFAKNAQASRPEDNMLSPPRQTISRHTTLPNGQTTEEEIELLSEYSWRNFFTSINFVRIMQKLSKHRSHRIWLLVQYKSSVSRSGCMHVSMYTQTSDFCYIGHFEAYAESIAPDATAACIKVAEEPGAVLWPKVATVYVNYSRV
jgi:Domain of unknown function (DUF3402)